MPGTLQAFWQGLGSGTRQVAQTVHPGAPTLAVEDSPAAKPLGWSDLASPSGIAPKIAFQFAQSYPTLAGGVVGGLAGGRLGALAGPGGAVAGDIWNPDTGAVTSLKSVDLDASSYQVKGRYVNALYSKLSRNVENLAEFTGGRYGGTNVREEEITSRTVTVIVPGLGSAEQRQVLRQIVEAGRQRRVMVRIEVYR
jgi:hypothetical protein